jgi:hypothetical protein
MTKKVRVKCFDVNNQAFCVANNNGNIIIELANGGRLEQTWNLDQEQNSNLFSLRSNSGQYLNFVANDTQVVVGPFDSNISSWDASNPTLQSTAIRPYTNTDQNLNALKGSYNNNPVGTWSWGGGDNNEVWNIEILP